MYFNRKNAEQKNWRMIKKGKHFLFGCSLVFAVGASLATQVVHANTAETTVANNSTTGDVNPTQNGDGKTYEAPAVAENKPEVAGTPAVSTTEPAVAAKLDGETAKEVKALDKTKLENYIAEIEAKLANGTYENKTEESVAVLKADLEAAKATLANATTQGEITKAYNKLVTTANTKLKNKPVEKKETPAVDTTNGKETVGKKAENTEKKSESNSIENTGSNDPRNGKALDKNNAFRAEIAYNIDSQGNDYGKKDSVITSGIRGSSESGNAITAVNSVMKYRARYNTDATGKITSVDWQVFFNDHLQNFANDYGVKNEVFRNYIQIPNEVNMPTDIRRLQYRAEMKFVDRKYQLVGGDGSALSDTVTFDNPTPSTAAGRALAKNENLKINGSWDNYTRGLDTLYNNTSFYYKDAVKDELSDTKNLVNSNALPGKRVIYDNSNTGGNYRDGYVWEFTTTVPNTVTNEQLKNMKVSMGMLSTGTAGVDHGFHRIAENPVNLSKADVTPPTVKTQTVKVNEQPKAENSIANFKDLPAGTKAEFKTPVNTATPGEKTATAVVTYSDGSKVEGPVKVIVEKEAAQPAAPVAPAAPAVAPTVEIPYSNKATKEVYVYAGEKNSFDIKFKDDSGKITSAIVNGGGNQPFNPVEGEANKINAKYGFTANKITTETPATADTPAVITYSGTPAATDDLTKDKLDAATKGENPKGMVLGWRYATATDTDGASIENKAVGISNATDPGSFLLMLKGQAQKYDIAAPTEKVTVADPANVTEAELGKIKEKLQLEYSQTNDDANLADKKGTTVADKDAKIQSVTKDDKGNLVVTYKDGSQDKKPLSEFVRTNEKPIVEIQYSDPAPNKKEVYVYASEVNSFDIKIKDDSGKIASAELRRGSNQEFKDVAGETNKQDTQYGFTANKFTSETTATAENPAVITYTGTPAPEGDFTKEKFEKAIQDGGTPLGWRFVKAIDKDGADARGNGRDATDPTAVNVILKPQTLKYDIQTPAEADKVVVSDVNNVTDKEFEKIKEKVKVEYSQNNPDARLADKKGKEVEAASKVVDKVEKEGNNLVVTYKDGSQDKKLLSELTRTNQKPTVEIQYSDPAPDKKEVYVYASEVNSFDIKIKDDSGKLASAELRRGSNQEFKDVAGETNKQNTEYGFTANKFTTETTATAENPAVITYTGTPAPEGKFTKEKFEKAIQDGGTPLGWRFVKAIDKDGADARGNGRDVTDPTAVNVILKPQTQKYDIKTPAEADKVVVSDVNNVTDKEFEKIKEKVKLEYSQNNPDARLADKKGTEVEAASKVVDKVEKEGNNLVVTYKDGSKDKKPLADLTKTADDAAKPNAGNDVVKPADKTVVANPEKLTDAEKKTIEDKVKAVNPGATVVVDDKGNATVTTPSGNTAVIPAADLTKTADDAAKPNAGNDVVKPADKTVVAN
ncbi:Rib/alpha-like domain-containing protein, partial [Streptococcus mitis]|uniref:Rib/alpha-like domain-containing protein n=1 Tax=Streptococcus mitis TaxID=28037 RepID=UPI0039C47629